MRRLSIALVTALMLVATTPLLASTECELTYKLDSWSLLYKEATGHGVISCDNGQWAPVKINARGVGLSIGKTTVDNGKGRFSQGKNLGGIFGTYV